MPHSLENMPINVRACNTIINRYFQGNNFNQIPLLVCILHKHE